MNLADYQAKARLTAVYPKENEAWYLSVGLPNEVGELLNWMKKYARGDEAYQDMRTNPEKLKLIEAEMGDILWYMALLADWFGISLADAAENNTKKLLSRYNRGKILGDGDVR